ncbi:MAG: radical SAM protein [Elusimicrobiota bacterium]
MSEDIVLINITTKWPFAELGGFEKKSMGAYYVAAAIEKAGYTVNLYEHNLDYDLSYDEEISAFTKFADSPAKLVGIGCHSVHLPFAVSVARYLKEKCPEKVILLGGIGPSAVAVRLMEKFSFLDAVVIGEGEVTMAELVRNEAGDFEGITGVVYRKDGVVYANELRKCAEVPDSLDGFDLSQVRIEKYQIPTVFTERGCPHNCTFCSAGDFWQQRLRSRSIESVIEELKQLSIQKGLRRIFFGDSFFCYDKERVLSLCEAVRDECPDIKWECIVQPELIDEEMMKSMSDSGCESVFFGMETGSEYVGKKIRKNFSLDKSISVIEKSVKYFKEARVRLIWGFPFEETEDFRKTMRIYNYITGDIGYTVNLRWLEPYVNTSLYRQYRDTLFLPEEESSIFKPHLVKKMLKEEVADYKGTGNSSVNHKFLDITNLRYISAAFHMAEIFGDLIKENRDIFSDYYRYYTPGLEAKLDTVRECSIY